MSGKPIRGSSTACPRIKSDRLLRCTLHLAEAIKSQCQAHLFFWITLPVGVGIALFVPQVYKLWWELPSDTAARLFLYLLFLVLLAWFYGPSLFLVVFRLPGPSRDARIRPQVNPGLRRLCVATELSACWLNAISRRLPTGGRVCAAGFLGAVFAGFWFLGPDPTNSRWYPISDAFLWQGALFASLIACWLVGPVIGTCLARAGIVAETVDRQRAHWMWGALGRVLSWLVITYLVGEVIWYLGSGPRPLGLSYRNYTIWAVAHLFSTAVVLASLVDYWNRWTSWPIRTLAIVAGVVFVWAQGPQDVPAPDLKAAEAPLDWYELLDRRLDAIPDGPAVLVTASGGGSRAAIFTALVLEALAKTPMGVKKSPDTDDDPEAHSTWGDHIVLISGVSGGSLATAYYVQGGGAAKFRRGSEGGSEERAIHNTSQQELIERMGGLAEDWLDEDYKKDSDSRETVAALRSVKRFCNSYPAEVPVRDAPSYRWAVESKFMDDMCQDFMAPILRGALAPRLTRGECLASFWADYFDWREPTNGDWLISSRKYHPESHPLALFNSCDVGCGSRFVTGFPPLPPDLSEDCFGDGGQGSGDEERPMRTFDSHYQIGLALAVRLSSNFPWGFRVLRIPPPEAMDAAEPVWILDGGMVDNTGVDTVHHLVKALDEAAEDGHGPAIRVLAKLRDRGVVIIEVDSGGKPSEGTVEDLITWIRTPLETHGRALFGSAELAKRHYKRELIELLSAGLDVSSKESTLEETDKIFLDGCRRQMPQTAFWLTFQCNHTNQPKDAAVMTAWALGPHDKATVLVQFLTEYFGWRKSVDLKMPEEFSRAFAGVENTRTVASAFLAERFLAKSRQSREEADRLAREIAALPKGDDSEAARVEDKRKLLLKSLDQQKVWLGNANKWASEADQDSEIEKLVSQVNTNIKELTDAKDVKPKDVRQLVQSIATSASNRRDLETAGHLRHVIRDATNKARSARDSVKSFQQELDRDATISRQYIQNALAK